MIVNATIQQMLFLLSLVMLGYILMKFNLLPNNSESVLSKLENYLFIPALVLNTFINNFTPDKLANAGALILFSVFIEILVILVSILCTHIITKDKYIRKIYLYGLCFSNFGFMGNTIVIPSAYGKDTTIASGMALISHIFSVITIPLIFTLIHF